MTRQKGLFTVLATFWSLSVLSGAVSVPVGVVEEARDLSARTYPGRVISVEEVSVVPQVSGEILEVGFRNGQMVKKGDVLYRIDPVKYVAAEKNAEAKRAQIKSNLEYSETLTVRYTELVKTRAVPQDDLDRARSEMNAQQAALAAAEADLLAARDDVKHCTVVAPIAGRVGSTAFTEGNFVSRGGAMLVKLVQVDPVRVSFEISSADYAAAFEADPARIVAEGKVSFCRVTGGETVAEGRVEYVENVANAATDSVKVYALVANGAGTLLAGQTVMATLSVAGGTLRAAARELKRV